MNLKKTLLAIAPIVMLALTLPLRAQSGCTDSPEDPTIVLALVAGACGIATTLLRRYNARQLTRNLHIALTFECESKSRTRWT